MFYCILRYTSRNRRGLFPHHNKFNAPSIDDAQKKAIILLRDRRRFRTCSSSIPVALLTLKKEDGTDSQIHKAFFLRSSFSNQKKLNNMEGHECWREVGHDTED